MHGPEAASTSGATVTADGASSTIQAIDVYDMFGVLSKASVSTAAIVGVVCFVCQADYALAPTADGQKFLKCLLPHLQAWKTIGWRLVVAVGSLYGALYLYERMTWTAKAKERAFKRQFADHAASKLQLIVEFTAQHSAQQVEE